MKKLLALMLLTLLLVTSCKKDDSITDNSTPDVSFKLNGTVWKATDFSAVFAANVFTITATKGSDELIIYINGAMPQTYTLNPSTSLYEFSAVYKTGIGTAGELDYTAKSGTLLLSQINSTLNYIYGTFSFSASSVQVFYKNFTSGIFTDLDYTINSKHSWLYSGAKGGTITALLDTTAWMSVNQVSIRNGNEFDITGVASGSDVLTINIHDTLTGNHALNDSLSIHAFDASWKPTSASTTEETYFGITGNLNLVTKDAVNRKISGTFSFNSKRTANPVISITEGKFYMVKFTE